MLQTVVGGILLIISQLLTVVALFLRFLPQLFALAVFLLRAILVASGLLYRTLLTRAVAITARAGFDLLSGWRRALCCVGMSLALGVVALIALQWVITPLAIGVCIAHGLITHFAWDQLAMPNGLHIGV